MELIVELLACGISSVCLMTAKNVSAIFA